MTRILVQNRYLANEGVTGATVAIDPPEAGAGPPVISGVTNHRGLVSLNTTGLTNGRHLLRVTPAHTTADAVGPNSATMPNPPARIYRSIDIQIELRGGAVSGVNVLPQQRINGNARTGGTPRIIVELQPVWMGSPNHRARDGARITTVIIHHTATANTQIALNTFLHAGTSAHYVIDREGQIVKMVQDGRRAAHAGKARWRGSRQINSSSIGIELVHRAQDNNYSQAHYTALLGLLDALRTAHPTIQTRNIIGHSDVGTNDRGRLGRKSSDPGEFFNWQELENQGIGMVPGAAADVATPIYGGLFDQAPNASFRRNDNDRRQRFSGAHRPDIEGTPVFDIQSDLSAIGYSVGTPDGDFGEMTHWAVMMFQEHFFAGGRGGNPNGRVDRTTGILIKRVLNGV